MEGEILTGNFAAHNTFANPDAVHTESFTGANIRDNKIKFTVPACSVLHLAVSVAE